MAIALRRLATNSDISTNPRYWDGEKGDAEIDRPCFAKFSGHESMDHSSGFFGRRLKYALARPKTRAKHTTGQFPVRAYGVKPIRGWSSVRSTFASYSGALARISPRCPITAETPSFAARTMGRPASMVRMRLICRCW